MTYSNFEFSAAGLGQNGVVRVDGHDLSNATRAVTVRAEVGHVTQVELDLRIIETSQMDLADVEILLLPGTHDALVALGWTPPVDSTQPQ